MTRFLIKVLLSAFIIAGVSELAKHSASLASVFAALPLTSMMILTWLYLDTGDAEQVSRLSTGIFWALLPSFLFLLSLPWLLRHGVRFPVAMLLSCGLMVAGYTVYVWGIGRLGIKL